MRNLKPLKFLAALALLPTDIILTIYVRALQLAARKNDPSTASFMAAGMIMVLEIFALMPWTIHAVTAILPDGGRDRLSGMIAFVPVLAANVLIFNRLQGTLLARYERLGLLHRRILDVAAASSFIFVIVFFFWSAPSPEQNAAWHCQHNRTHCNR